MIIPSQELDEAVLKLSHSIAPCRMTHFSGFLVGIQEQSFYPFIVMNLTYEFQQLFIQLYTHSRELRKPTMKRKVFCCIDSPKPTRTIFCLQGSLLTQFKLFSNHTWIPFLGFLVRQILCHLRCHHSRFRKEPESVNPKMMWFQVSHWKPWTGDIFGRGAEMLDL
jgi:hypothetical protein